RASPFACGRRRGTGCIPATRPPRYGTRSYRLCSRSRSASSPHIKRHRGRRSDGRLQGRCPRRNGAPTATYGRDAVGSRGRFASGDQSGASPPPAPDNRDLRKGRPRGPPTARAPMAGRCAMSGLRQALVEYLRLRRSLGYTLRRPEKSLQQFLDYLETAGVETITTEHALAWACQPARSDSSWWSLRLCAVRGFAKYMQNFDSRTEVPPRDLLTWQSPRDCPYLYTAA